MKKAILFPGQGSQIIGMSKDFYDNFKISKEVFNEVESSIGKKLSDIMFNGPMEELTKTSNAQPAIMTSCIAILKALENELNSDIIKLCNFVAGHSLGEYTALCASNCIKLSDTAKLLKIRGEAFEDASIKNPGGMAVIGAPVDIVEKIVGEAIIDGEILEVTNDNTNEQVVISGHINSIDNALEKAKQQGIKKVKKLAVSGAFHSNLMNPAINIMQDALENIDIDEPKVGIFSNYTSELEEKKDIKDNLIKQITHKVRWRETILNMEKLDVTQFIEIGPGKILSNMVKKICPDAETLSISSIESMKDFLKMF